MTAYDQFVENCEKVGLEKGLELGEPEGKLEGERLAKINAIIKAYEKGKNLDVFAEILEMTNEEVNQVIEDYKNGKLDIIPNTIWFWKTFIAYRYYSQAFIAKEITKS
jgi:hypothetical protein